MTAGASPRDAARRRAQLAAIHVARAQLAQHGMDEDAYRAVVRRVSAAHGAETDSAANLDDGQRRAVLDEMRRLGAERPAGQRQARTYPGKPYNFGKLPELITKIEAQLANMGLAWAYADAIARQQHGVEKVAWVRHPEQLRAIVAALHVEQEKRALDAAVTAELARLGWAPERVVELLRPLRPHWRRHRPSLRLVLEFLATQQGEPHATA